MGRASRIPLQFCSITKPLCQKKKIDLTIGTDGLALPILPPDRDVRVWAKLVRVMFYTPGFMALLLIKTGEPAGFGITVELLMLSSAAAVVAGIFVGSQVVGGGGGPFRPRSAFGAVHW